MAYTDAKIIGEVTEVTGDAKIIRTDGSEEPIILGSPIYEGDIVETEGSGAVNIGFVDESSFAVSSDARIAIDEFVFDPASESGAQDFSVLRGVFMYTSGLIGRENPDSVEIDTPVGSIGIRGTIIGGTINPDGESQVTVLEGAIVVRNDGGEQLLSTQYDTVRLSSMSQAPSAVETLTVQDMADKFSSIKGVSAGLFSSFNDQMQQDGPSNNLDESSVDESIDAQADEENAEDQTTVEDAAVQEIVASEKQTIELKTVGDDKKPAPASQDMNAKEARETISDVREPNANDDTTNVKFIEKIADQGFVFKGDTSIDENSPVGTVIGQVEATKALPFNVTYSLLSDAGGTLHINPKTGVISLKSTANFEAVANPVSGIQVVATRTDTGASKQFTFNVNLHDVNESAQITGHTTGILAENDSGLANDTVVSNLSFIEVDTKTSAFQTQFSTNDSRFRVEMNGGQLQLVAIAGAAFDYESDPSVIVSISQTDGSNVYADYDVTVNISNLIDETPTNITVNASTVAENALDDALVATLSTTDADVGDSFTYEILDGNDDNIFKIDGSDIKIWDNANLDFETMNSYNLTIRVTDNNNHSYDKVITIGVNDINEPGVIVLNEEDFNINNSNAGALTLNKFGAVIGVIDVNDPEGDAYAASDFSINGNIAGGPLSNYFEIVQDGNSFLLKLHENYKITSDGSNYSILESGGNSTFLGGATSYSMNLTLSGGNNITVNFGLVESQALNDPATATNDVFTIFGDNFTAIDGGAGHDLLRLDGFQMKGQRDTFDLRSVNTDATTGGLRSIEEIKLNGGLFDKENTLKLNITQLSDLLESSDNQIIKFSTGSYGNKVEFYDENGKTSLLDNDFIGKDINNDGYFTTADKNGDGYYVFEHSTLGTILIEDGIIGAAGGGSVS